MYPAPTPTFHRELKRLRQSRKLSQSKLAEAADVDHSYVSRLEARTRFPTRDAIDRFADAMQLTSGERKELFAAALFLTDPKPAIPHAEEIGSFLQDSQIPAAIRELVTNQLEIIVAGIRRLQQETA